jgi:hypothetical protein
LVVIVCARRGVFRKQLQVDMSPFNLNDNTATVYICRDRDAKEGDSGFGEIAGGRQA